MMDARQKNRAETLLRRLSRFKAIRANWEGIWQFLAERTDPKNACMNYPHYPGQINNAAQKFDSTATLAIPKWASAIDGLTTPKTQKWHGLTLTDKGLSDKFKVYLESARDVLFARRYAARSNFTNANYEALKTVGHYGGAPFSVTRDPLRPKGVLYKTWPIKDFYIDQNFQGDVDTFFRVYTVTARQAMQEFGEDRVPLEIKHCSNLDEQFEILHAVYPNEEFDPASLNSMYKRFASVYLSCKSGTIIEEGGFDKCPYLYQRYDVVPSLQDPYGYSPLMLCLPEVRDLNAMVRDNLRVGNRMGSPTLLMSEDDIINRDQIAPGRLVAEGLDANGNPRVKPLELPGNLPFTLEFIKGFQDTVKQTFGLDLFQILINKPDMTATEVLQRAQEQATLMTPTTSRREKEFLGPMIEVELDLAFKQGDMPPMPEELVEAMSAGDVEFSIEYESPIRRAQNADDGTAVLRVLQSAASLQAFDPTVKNMINANRTLEILGDVWGAPVDMFNTPEEKAVMDMNDAQAKQAQLMLEAAPLIGKSAKDLAQAQVAAVGNKIV